MEILEPRVPDLFTAFDCWFYWAKGMGSNVVLCDYIVFRLHAPSELRIKYILNKEDLANRGLCRLHSMTASRTQEQLNSSSSSDLVTHLALNESMYNVMLISLYL